MALDRPISAVVHDIMGNVQDIVRFETRLAKTELREELVKMRSAGILLGIGTLMLTLTTAFILLSIVHALSLVLPAWMAALIVAAGAGLVAAICLGIGMKKLKALQGVPRTNASLKENAEWARQLTR
jgi:pilus assembly protein TadC